MRETEFDAYLAARGLSKGSRRQCRTGVRRIERAYETDIDREFETDGLSRILKDLTYKSGDKHAERPNPSPLVLNGADVSGSLRTHRYFLKEYVRFRSRAAAANDSDPPHDASDAIPDAEPPMPNTVRTFILERDMHAALRANLTDLERGLVAIDSGRERRVAAGEIDILARDSAGTLTVIELKADRAKPEAVAQILAYMSSIAENTNEPVRGILVAAEMHPRVVQAARAVGNLSLKKYRFRFEFE